MKVLKMHIYSIMFAALIVLPTITQAGTWLSPMIDGDTSEWVNVPAVITMTTDNHQSVKVSNDDNNIYLLIEFDGPRSAWALYFDTIAGSNAACNFYPPINPEQELHFFSTNPPQPQLKQYSPNCAYSSSYSPNNEVNGNMIFEMAIPRNRLVSIGVNQFDIAFADRRTEIGTYFIEENAPTLTISPSSGKFLDTQFLDITLIVKSQSASIGVTTMTLGGVNISTDFNTCAVPGTLASGGQTLRCSGVPATNLGLGDHVLSASIQLSDGTIVNDSITLSILDVTE